MLSVVWWLETLDTSGYVCAAYKPNLSVQGVEFQFLKGKHISICAHDELVASLLAYLDLTSCGEGLEAES